MSDDMSTVINSLDTLRTGTIRAGVEFKGLTKTLTSAAASTEGAGKAWTTFSRLVSGTPLWSTQNKIRAYLSILAGFETRSKANAEAHSKEAQKLLDKIKGYEELNKVMKDVNDNQMALITSTGNLDDDMIESLKYTEAYQSVFQATGDTEKAMLRAIKFMNNRNSLIKEEQLAIKKTAKIAYAFDNNRVKDAKKLAKMKAEEKGKGFFGKRMASFGAGIKERYAQKSDQLGAGRAVRRDAARANAKGVTDNLKSAKMLLAPLLLVTKSTKLIYTAFNPFSKGAIKFRMKMRQFTMKLQPIMSMAFKYLIMSMLAIAGFFVILVYLKRYYEILEEFGVIDEIKVLGYMVFDWLKLGWKLVSSFINGDYEKALDYLGMFVDDGIDILIKLGKVLWDAGFLALVAGFDLLMDAVYKFYKDPAFRKKVMDILMKVALVVVALIVIQFLIGLALSLAAAAALPILIGIAVLAALFSVAYWLDKKFGDYYQDIEDKINNALNTVVHFFDTLVNDITNFFIKAKNDIIYGFTEFFKVIRGFFDFSKKTEAAKSWMRDGLGSILEFMRKIFSALDAEGNVRKGYNALKDDIQNKGFFKAITGKAMGGTSHGGMTLVGEQGPELVNLPAGASVKTNYQTNRMMGGTTVNNYITINAKDTSKAEMRRIANELSNMINMKVNRSGSSRTMG